MKIQICLIQPLIKNKLLFIYPCEEKFVKNRPLRFFLLEFNHVLSSLTKFVNIACKFPENPVYLKV